MDASTLEKYKEYCRDLTSNDRSEIEKMLLNDDYAEFKDVLEKMLELNKKLEQEIVVY